MNKKGSIKLQRSRVRDMVEQIRALEWDYVDRCNVCQDMKRIVVARSDRYGFPARLAVCNNCGLGYLIDRLSRESYSEFYKKWYRRLLSKWFDQSINNGFLNGYAKSYADQLVALLDRELRLPNGFTVLDVGGSTGAVSLELMKRYQAKPTVLDPSEEELSVAQSRGMKTILGQIEEKNNIEGQFDLLLICRALDHMFDLRVTLEVARNLVKPGGYVFIDYMDFLEHAKYEGSAEIAARLDHCYYFYNEMAPYLYSRFGFSITSTFFSISLGTIGYLLKPGAKSVQSIPVDIVSQVVRQLLQLDREWSSAPAIRDFTIGQRIRSRVKTTLTGHS